MLRLIRFLISLTLFAAFGYFAYTVPLGQKTLWEHTKAIAGSKESADLVEGVKKKVKKVMPEDGKKEVEKLAEDLSPSEKEVLKKLIKKKLEE